MSHQISLPNDMLFVGVYLVLIGVLIGTFLFAIEVKELQRKKKKAKLV